MRHFSPHSCPGVPDRWGARSRKGRGCAFARLQRRAPQPQQVTLRCELARAGGLAGADADDGLLRRPVRNVGSRCDEIIHVHCDHSLETSCWPPSMSKVAPVSAVLVMMCTARAATSAGPTTRRMGASRGAGRGAAEFGRAPLEAVGVAAGQDNAGALGAGPASRLKPDAGAAADHDNGLPGQFRLALGGSDGGCGGHD